ncbi:MAG: DUF488 domain-containing protein [Acidiferrobacter sp.]
MRRPDSLITLRRAYDPPVAGEGRRFLVDRLWPRGLRKETLRIERWYKDIGPSPELRRWFDHDPVRFAEFSRRYRAELAQKPDLVDELRRAAATPIVLIYGARDPDHNHAVVLRDVLIHG